MLPLQAPPDQPVKAEFAAGVSVSVTLDPVLKLALQAVPQLIPAGLLETLPVPVPPRVTIITGALWMTLKVAVTCWFAVRGTAQVRLVLLLHSPVQPAKEEFEPGVAVRVTWVPGSKEALHVWPQLIPDGLLATLPFPVPASVTPKVGEVLKLAMTDVSCVTVTLQAPVPLQAPDHPAKKELVAGEAVSVTCVPLLKLALQAWLQLIPAGLLLMVPPPAPAAWTLSWKEPPGKLELLPPPPQPDKTRNVELKQQMRARYFNVDIKRQFPLRTSARNDFDLLPRPDTFSMVLVRRGLSVGIDRQNPRWTRQL